MAKEPLALRWIEELLPKEFFRKPMFGGFAYYIDERIVLAVFENPGDRTYRKHKFNFDLWNGCLFPVEREHHQEITNSFPVLIPHPVLTKWLYIPADTENFDTHIEEIMKEIRRRSKIFGVVPKTKKPKKLKADVVSSKNIDTRRPRMFSDEPFKDRIKKATKVSDLKNLGPTSEKEFLKAGIKTANQFVKLGWKKSLEKLVKSNPKNRHSIFAYALIGALQNKEWNRISDEDKLEAKEFVASLKKSELKKKS